MKILFSNAPWHKVEQNQSCPNGWLGIRGGSRWPHTVEYRGGPLINSSYLPFPFFLAYGAALAGRAGVGEVRVRDSIALGESYQDYYNFLCYFRPDIVIMETSTPSLNNDLAIIHTIRQGLPNITVVLCGIHFELEQQQFLSDHPEIDYIVYGEFEQSILQLLQYLANQDKALALDQITNLVYRQSGQVVKNPTGPLADINQFPFPQHDELPYENYFDSVCGLPRPQLQILTTRGCPYGCIFCVWPQLVYRGKAYRKRDVKSVADEIECNFRRFPYQSFYVDDDTFNVHRGHVMALADELIRRKLNHIPWGAMCRADLMDRELLLRLKEAGLYSVKYGVESADQTVLNEIDKRLDLQKTITAVNLTRELGIKVHLTFTFGLPSDTKETIEKTIDLACQLPNDSVQFSIATPFPGTEMYRIYDQKGWITTKNWDHYNGSSQAVSRTDYFSGEQLQEYINIAYRRSANARILRSISNSGFKERLAAALAGKIGQNKPVLLLQSAIVDFSKTILDILLQLPVDVHLMLHQRFVPEFAQKLPKSKLHVFNQSTNFNVAPLAEFARSLQRFKFAGAIVPFSNPYGGGYEEVLQLAEMAAGKVLIRITSEGMIV